jgi:hypothetical protein
MGKEFNKPFEREVRRSQVNGFVERVMADPKLVFVKSPTIDLPSLYKKTVIDIAVDISFLSVNQIKEEAHKLDEWAEDSGYAQDRSNEWKPLIEQSKQHEYMMRDTLKNILPDSEIVLRTNTLLKHRVIKRKIERVLSEAEYSGEFQKDQTKTALATNICIHAVNELSSTIN